MQFYFVSCSLKGITSIDHANLKFAGSFEYGKKSILVPIALSCRKFTALMAVDFDDTAEACIARFAENLGATSKITSQTEICLMDFMSKVMELLSDREVNAPSKLSEFVCKTELIMFGDSRYSDALIVMGCPTESNRAKLRRRCQENMMSGVDRELKRIFDKRSPKEFCGHPVHYILAEQTAGESESRLDCLLAGLYLGHRLRSRFSCRIDLNARPLSPHDLEVVFYAFMGGSVVVPLPEADKEGNSMSQDFFRENLSNLVSIVRKYQYSVLTIFQIPYSRKSEANRLCGFLSEMNFVTVRNDRSDRKSTLRYLKTLGEKVGLPENVSLEEFLPKDKDFFSKQDATSLFYRKRNEQMIAEQFPAYSPFAHHGRHSDGISSEFSLTDEHTDGVDGLDSLIGLSEAKETIRQVTDHAAAQEIYRSHGFKAEQPRLHMIFTGNPGTAKTTVARIFGQICAEKGILPGRRFVEVGRQDLCGQYVGHTAKKVEEVFQRAKGGVLFIDEAYSLSDGHRGLYGEEAVNTIVQLMENNRDTAVIFAGYPDKMQEFLEVNQGLKSRIPFHLSFPDYTLNELTDILSKILADRQRTLTPEAKEKAVALLSRAMQEPDYGNGRFVRNLVEKALFAQSARIMATPKDQITDDMIAKLIPEDFPDAKPLPTVLHRPIGFTA